MARTAQQENERLGADREEAKEIEKNPPHGIS